MRQQSQDGFLGGRVSAAQPPSGFRSGLDAVMLAACVPAGNGDECLELGSGAGVASLCLAARVVGCSITGIEIDSGLAALANTNAAANGVEDRVHFVAGDALDPPRTLRKSFDHVFCNPPFHDDEGKRSPDAERARALHDEGRFADWLTAGLKRVVSQGTLTAIIRADRLSEALAALPHNGLNVFALWPRAGEPAKRVILQLHKGARSRLQFLPGLILHEEGGRYTAKADAILRGLAALPLASPKPGRN